MASMMEACLRKVEQLVQQQQNKYHGPFCLGSFSPTVADIYVFTQVQDARNQCLPVDSICPTLATIALLCETHPWFLDSQPNAVHDKMTASTTKRIRL
jgi:hypothetical protein